MNIKIIGPLVVWSLLFIIGASIKLIGFSDPFILFEIAPEVSLWATGVLFTIAASEETYNRARTEPHYSKKESSLEIEWKVIIPDEVDFTPKFMYILIGSLAGWILSLLLSENAISVYSSSQQITEWVIIGILVPVLISSGILVIAIRTLIEVTK